jgi:predicted nucleic acid-binding protein
MIHLDTNYVIGLVATPSPFKSQLLAWLNAGEKLAVSSIAWSEFLNGPVDQREIHDAFEIVEGRIIAFGEVEAAKSAEVFNLTGRKRPTQIDCFIAASAICSSAALATVNRKDFTPFIAAGLHLA